MTLTAEQLEQRKGRIGSSDAPIIAGLHPAVSPLQSWLRISGRDTFEGNEATRNGQAFEEPIGRLSAEALQLNGVTPNIETRLHDDFACATPDFRQDRLTDIVSSAASVGVARLIGLLEAKMVGVGMSRYWERDAGLPPSYVTAQCQYQMAIWGVDVCYVGALVAGAGPYTYRVDYDKEYADGLLQIARDFHRDHIVADVPPELDGSKAARECLQKKHPQHVERVVVAISGGRSRFSRKRKQTLSTSSWPLWATLSDSTPRTARSRGAPPKATRGPLWS
jgi:predicted phage-related endonuclease